MTKFSFPLTIDGADVMAEEAREALFHAGCDDARFGVSNGVQTAEFDREAGNFTEAVSEHGPFRKSGSSGGCGAPPTALSVLDAYAVLAYLKGEAAAPEVRVLLDDDGSSLTALGVAEVLDHLVRVAGADEEEAVLDVAQLGLLDGLVVDSTLGMAAGRLRGRHYHRRRCEMSLADCVAAEAARSRGEALATSDPHLLDVCHAEGIAVIVLPGSTGSLWTPPPP